MTAISQWTRTHSQRINFTSQAHIHTHSLSVKPWERIHKPNWINSKDRSILHNILVAGNVNFSIEQDWKTTIINSKQLIYLNLFTPKLISFAYWLSNLFYSILNMLRFQLKLEWMLICRELWTVYLDGMWRKPVQ